MQKHISSVILLAASLGSVFLAGCASSSLDLNIPMNRFQTPTTSGGMLKGKVGYFTSGGATVKVVNDMTQTPPDSSGTSIGNLTTSSGGFDLNLGLAQMVDIVSVYGGAGLKVQFLGIGSHDWAGSLRVAEASSNSNNTITVAGNTYSGQASLSVWEYGVSIGRYVSQDFMLYGSAGYRNLKGNSNIQQPGQSYNYSDTGTQVLASLGGEYEIQHFNFGIEAGGGTTTWSRASQYTNTFIGVEGAFHW